MNKYYRVRTKVQWNWLMKWFEEQGFRWSNGTKINKIPRMYTKDTVIKVKDNKLCYASYDFYAYDQGITDFIEVSQMMEDEKMEEPMTEIILDNLNQVNHGVRFEDGKKISFIDVPTRLIYPKIQFTEAEKKEFDSIDNDETLSNALDIIELEDYPNLYGRIYYHTVPEYQKFELEFARAWADPSLIEVLPEKKWNVRVPATSYQMYYYKLDDKISTYMPSQSDLKNDKNSQFTAKELKHYGLDNDLFEKVEVKE